MSELLCAIFPFEMSVPIPLRLVLTSATLCVLNVILLPDVFFQETKLATPLLYNHQRSLRLVGESGKLSYTQQGLAHFELSRGQR